jgi:hypothetical protein
MQDTHQFRIEATRQNVNTSTLFIRDRSKGDKLTHSLRKDTISLAIARALQLSASYNQHASGTKLPT